MIVRRISADDRNYLRLAEDASLFAMPSWVRAQGDGGALFGVFKGDQIRAVFLLYTYTRLGTTFFIDPLFAPHCGLHMAIESEKRYGAQTDEKRIVRAIAEHFSTAHKRDVVEFSLPQKIKDVQPFLENGFSASPKYTFVLDLSFNDEHLLSQMSPERRKNIRQGMKEDFELTWNSDPEVVLQLIGDTLTRAGVVWNKSTLERLLHPDNGATYHVVLRQNGIPMAAALAGFDKKTAYYLGGGHKHEIENIYAGTFALWQLIIEARRRGLTEFNFLGSSIPSIEQYFRGFGAELTPYFTVKAGPVWMRLLRRLKRTIRK
jgi:hypothetical protein